MASAYGCNTEIKGSFSLKDYKTYMDKAVWEKPYLFLDYAINDVNITMDLPGKVAEAFNNTLRDVFMVTDLKEEITRANIPMTIGSLVNSLVRKYMKYHVYNNDPKVIIAMAKLSILNPLAKSYKTNLDVFERLKAYKSLNDLDNFSK